MWINKFRDSCLFNIFNRSPPILVILDEFKYDQINKIVNQGELIMNFKHYKIFLAILSLLILFSLKLYAQDEYQPGKIIAKFRSGIVNVPEGENSVIPDGQSILDDSLLSLLNEIGTTTLDKLVSWSQEGDSLILSPITGEQVFIHDWSRVFVINFNEEVDVNTTVDQMNQLESVIYAEPDAIATPDTIPNDPYFSSQWYLLNNVNPKFDIDATTAWDYSKGDNIIIAIIDEGVDVHHIDLATHIWKGGGSETGMPSGNHGTYVAGIAGAVTNNNIGIAGIGWNSLLMPRDCHVWTLDSLVYDILDASLNNGAHLLNCSWHTVYNYSSLRNAIEDAFDTGSNIVASMGNKNPNDPPYTAYPAAYNNWVIAVGALLKVNHGDTLYARPDMNYGSFIDVTAPGDSIFTTQWKISNPTNHESFAYFGMTSAAAPIVTGVTALIRSRFPNIKNNEVMDIVSQSAVLFKEWENDFNHYGYGMVNAFFAVAPPAAPQNLYVDFAIRNHPTVHWDANAEPDLKGYHVYRMISPPYQQERLTSTPIADTFFVDEELVQGEQFQAHYWTKAVDFTDQLSEA